MFTTFHLKGLIAAAVLTAGATPSWATKLDDITCDALKLERSRMETEGIKSDMEKGPEWAKSNLSKDRLTEIEQLLILQENIAFRCPLPKPPPPDPIDPNAAKANGPGDGTDKKLQEPAVNGAVNTQADNEPAVFGLMPGLSPPGQNPRVTKSPTATIQKAKPATVQQETGAQPQPLAQKPPVAAKPKPQAATSGATKAEGGALPVAKKAKVEDAYQPPRIEVVPNNAAPKAPTKPAAPASVAPPAAGSGPQGQALSP